MATNDWDAFAECVIRTGRFWVSRDVFLEILETQRSDPDSLTVLPGMGLGGPSTVDMAVLFSLPARTWFARANGKPPVYARLRTDLGGALSVYGRRRQRR